MEKDYNGWTNRETWLINIHFNPESKEDLEYIKDEVYEYVENIDNLFIQDFIDLDKINWGELEKHFD